MAPRRAIQNPNYKIEIAKFNNKSVAGKANNSAYDSILATIPEEIALNVQSEYEARYANFFAESRIGQAVKEFQNLTGAGLFFQALTSQLWINSDPLELSLQLLFDAEEDAQKDVVDQVVKLQSWVMPTIDESDSNILYAPGPTPYDPNSGRVVVSIGRFLTLDSVIIPSVSATYKAAMDKNGQPISATVDVTFRTYITPHQQEFMDYFRNFDNLSSVAAPKGAANIENFFSKIRGSLGI